jgi:hypothetical protein
MEDNMGNNIGMNTYHGEQHWDKEIPRRTTLGKMSTKENNIGNFIGGNNTKENNIGNFMRGGVDNTKENNIGNFMG